MMKRSMILALLAALPLGAQTAQQPAPSQPAPAQAQPAVPAQAQPQQPPADPDLQEATRLANAGDLAGAAQKLEALRKTRPNVSPPVLALLGALYLELDKPREALAVLKPLADPENAEAAVLYNAGRAALALKQTEAGIGYLARSARLAPGSPAARDLGLLAMRHGQVVEAYGWLIPWLAVNPRDAEARLAAASLAVQLERAQDAENLLQGMPENEPALNLLRGRVAVLKGDGAAAVALLEPLLANHPPGVELEVRRALAEAYLVANRPADAIKVLQGKAGTHPALVLLLGRAQRRAGDAGAALATLKPLADRLPADAKGVGDPRPAVGIAVEYASLLVEGNRAAEAVPYLEKAARIHPGSREAWQTLAQALDAAGRKDEAARARARVDEIAQAAARPAPAAAPAPAAGSAQQAQQAADPALSPDFQEALRLVAQDQEEKALEAVRRELQKSPSSAQARILEFRLLLSLKRHEEALRITEAALQQEPGNADLVYQRGVAQIALKNWSAGEKDLRRTLELQPRHTGAMNDLAVLLVSQGKKAEAQSLLEQVLQLNPKDQMAAANLKALKEGAIEKSQ